LITVAVDNSSSMINGPFIRIHPIYIISLPNFSNTDLFNLTSLPSSNLPSYLTIEIRLLLD